MNFELVFGDETEIKNPTIHDIAEAIEALEPDNEKYRMITLFPSKNIKNSRYLSVEYNKDDTGETLLILTMMLEQDNEPDKYFSYYAKDKNEVKEIINNYFISHKIPDLKLWDEDFMQDTDEEGKYIKLELFKEAFKTLRDNGNEIYKGFGFRHHSDVTQYYVHPNNQSSDGKTSLCQPIGESVIMFSMLMADIMNMDKPFGDYKYSEDKKIFALEFKVPDDWHTMEIIDRDIGSYEVYLISNEITFWAIRQDGTYIKDKLMPLENNYKLLPCFMILLAKEMETNPDFSVLMKNFIESPAADIFVNINEDFYQNHKNDEYKIYYQEPPELHKTVSILCSSQYEALRNNKKSLGTVKDIKLNTFTENDFKKEYLELIPSLGNEFKLQNELYCLCNAIQSGDTRAVLFHGPAGTGKTIACKLVCQEIKLPIMDTVNCTENLDEFILGKFNPDGEKIVFKESFVTKAIRDGGAVVFEEINFAKPQYLAFLNSLLDDNGFVRLDNNNEIVKRHPNFRFFATMNLGYFGTKELNQALFNRFNAVIELAALSDKSIKNMLTVRVPESKDFIDKILGVYHKIRKKIESEELDIVISPRNLENWARLAKHEGYLRAAEKTIVPIAKNDRALEAAIKGIIFLYKWT